jgi:uncharacterized protein DUF1566
MKKILAISLVMNAALAAGLSWKQLSAQAAGGGVPIANGDVNGDGSIDLSDAVYLLSGLFLGGPAPLDIRCPLPANEHGLPATGQMMCYDLYANEIDCVSPDFPGQDGFYRAGCSGEGRFVDNRDGTVTDTCTELMWQIDTADINGNGMIGDEDRPDWSGALKYCEELELAGHTDWRLPNVREIQSIVDFGRFQPSIDPVFSANFGGLSAGWYWSSSSVARVPDFAWQVNFDDGFVSFCRGDTCGKYGPAFVRAVRQVP